MLIDDTYKTIAAKTHGDFRDRGSKFIAEAFPVGNEEEAKMILAETKKKNPKANHHCYALRLTPDRSIFKFSDDREPSGSAGRPILNAILSNDLTNIIVIVSRYFGGMQLGIPGLINAYRSAAQDSIRHATIITKTINEKYELQFDYSLLNVVMNILKNEGAMISDQNFSQCCILKFEIRKSKADGLLERIQKNHLLVNTCKIISIK